MMSSRDDVHGTLNIEPDGGFAAEEGEGLFMRATAVICCSLGGMLYSGKPVGEIVNEIKCIFTMIFLLFLQQILQKIELCKNN